uniref:SOWAHA-C winged helix-turn-helix domain-containing protein n=1 Tax=Astatotilapia calliptera TaxID=8154 RepID=A0A3P8QBE0_ASTCA
MSDVSEESLLDYFYSAGGDSGRVKNADILRTFKPFIGHSDLQLRAKYREEFKLIIDRIAVVKSENGEKYLILKKKYRNLVQEREAKHLRPDGDRKRHLSPARTTTTSVQWEVTDAPTSTHHEKEEQDVPMSCGEADATAEVNLKSAHYSLLIVKRKGADPVHHSPRPPPAIQIHEAPEQSNAEDELDRDSGSKVTLDPLEKEWIYSAAGARVPDLSQLLRQDRALANKKVTALHWAAKHGNEEMATLVVNAGGDVNIKSVSGYTPLHIAALHGHRHILDLLVGTYGAKENLRDYSGHLACHYLNIKEAEEFQVTQARERNKNRKLASLFHSKKKWGSAEELAPIEEERTASHQLALPAFRPRKFSR